MECSWNKSFKIFLGKQSLKKHENVNPHKYKIVTELLTIPLHFLEQFHVTSCNFEDFVYAFEEIKIVQELTDAEIFFKYEWSALRQRGKQHRW